MKNIETRPDTPLKTRLAALQRAITLASQSHLQSGKGKHGEMKGPSAPILIGVSKTHPAEAVLEAYHAGLREFGENKVQEAAAKFPALKAQYPDMRLHLIGPLQSNKAADAVALFDVIHTVDRPKIAEAILAASQKQGVTPPSCLVQVNIGEEEQKAGVMPQDLGALLAHCQSIGLPITGLMCIPPADKNPNPYFALMQQWKQHYQLAELSMGMSGDFESAIRLGATMVRVGTALFGERR